MSPFQDKCWQIPGNLLMIGKSMKATFYFVKERMWRKINSLSGKFLSKAGCEVMVKALLQAIPTYVMSAYLLPQSTIDKIQHMMNSYWWGTNGMGMKLLKWERLIVRKDQGSMNFRNLFCFHVPWGISWTPTLAMIQA